MPSPTAPDGFVVKTFSTDEINLCRDHVRARLGLAPFEPKNKDQKTRQFDYRDPNTGEPRYSKIRHDNANGTKKIYFKPTKRGGSPALLYGGERLAKTVPDTLIWICEGEPKVDRLMELGAVAVSGDTGAESKWLPDHARLLRGRRIILWPDSDEPGENYIRNAAAAIRADSPDADIRVVRPFPHAAKEEKGKDVCDWRGDAVAFAELVAGAEKYVERLRVADPQPCAQRQPPIVDLVNAATIPPEPISWLWEGWLARGKMHLIGGQPGTGKTTIAMSIAATVSIAASRPARWPDGTKCEKGGNVIIWSGEDDPADTLVPRLLAAGADLKRIFFVGGVREGEKSRDFDPAKDIPALRAAIDQAGGAALLAVDPIVSAVSGDSHKNAETRRGLQPLVELARDIDAALIGVTHFSKGTSGREPTERITGSLAFGALARIIMVAAIKAAQGEGKAPSRMFARAKSNIGPDGGGFIYDLCQVELQERAGVFGSRVEWGEALDGAARDLLADAEQEQDGGAGRDAENFLREILADGPKSAKELRDAADAHGLVWKTVQRAKGKIPGIIVRKIPGSRFGGWEWNLQEGHKEDKDAHPGILSSLSSLSFLSPANKKDKKDKRDKKDIKNCGGVDPLDPVACLRGKSSAIDGDMAEGEL
jgi:hypothetical protein